MPVFRFGHYELRTETSQLFKNGVRLKLQQKPAQLLLALVSSPGELITREALRQKLWPDGTYVDFEGSINTAINRLRAALNDCPDDPIYIETVPRLGYRFIYPLNQPLEADAVPFKSGLRLDSASESPAVHLVPTAAAATQHAHSLRRAVLASAAALLLCVAVYQAAAWFQSPVLSPRFRQLTFQPSSIAAARFTPGLANIAYTSLLGNGQKETKAIQLNDLRVDSVQSCTAAASLLAGTGPSKSPDKRVDDPCLLAAFTHPNKSERKLLGGMLAADWTANHTDLAVLRRMGSQSVIEFPRGHRIFASQGWVSDLRVSPAGDRVAFLEHPTRDDDAGFVQMVERNGRAHRLTSLWSSTSGLAWSASGREIWFSAGKESGTLSLNAVSPTGRVRQIFASPSSLHVFDSSRSGDLLVSVDEPRMSLLTGRRGETGETDVSKFDFSHIDGISDDGRYLLFTECSSAAGLHYTTYLRDLTSQTTTPVAFGRGLALSADGRRAITIDPQDRKKVMLHDLESGQSGSIGIPDFEYQWARFLSSRSEILVGGSRKGGALSTFRYRLNTRELTKLNLAVYLDEVVVSSTGHQIAGISEGQLRLFDWQTGNETCLPGEGGASFPVGWSLDGQTLYALNTRNLVISAVDRASGKWQPWHTLKGNEKPGYAGIAGITAAPQAGVYAYSLHLSSSRLYLVSGLSATVVD